MVVYQKWFEDEIARWKVRQPRYVLSKQLKKIHMQQRGKMGSGARPEEAVPEGRRDVGDGRSDLRTIWQGGRRVGGPPEPALCRRERHGQRIGPLRQLWVSYLGGYDCVNDAPFSPLHTPAEGIRPHL